MSESKSINVCDSRWYGSFAHNSAEEETYSLRVTADSPIAIRHLGILGQATSGTPVDMEVRKEYPGSASSSAVAGLSMTMSVDSTVYEEIETDEIYLFPGQALLITANSFPGIRQVTFDWIALDRRYPPQLPQ